jgi:hypothetical protein
MLKAIVIFASNPQAETPQMGVSDRAAVGLAASRFAGPVIGFCPCHDQLAMNYGIAAKTATLAPLPTPAEMDFDVALMGQCALTAFGDELAGILAEQKNATLIFDVLDFHQEGSVLRVIKDVGNGNREEWTITGPVVMVISADAVRPPYVSRYRRMMAARDLPDEVEQLEAFAIRVAEWEGVRPRAKLGRRAELYSGQAEDRMSAAFGIAAASASGANDRIIRADAVTCARHLLRYLAHQGFLPARLGKTLPERDEKSVAAQPPRESLTPTGFRGVSVSQRTARGPRFPNDSPQRLARRPRIVQTDCSNLPTNASQKRGPRTLDRPPSGLARKPRRRN